MNPKPNEQSSGIQNADTFSLNDSIVSITGIGEIVLQLLRIEKHAAKTGETEAGELIAKAKAIFERRE